MNKVLLCVLVFVLFVAAGCGGAPTGDDSPSEGASSPSGDTSSSESGDRRTLDPCALLTGEQVATAIGAPIAEITPGEVPGAVTCDYMADSSAPGRTPHLFIMAYTDQTLAEFEDVGTGNARAWWDNFNGSLEAGKTGEGSELSYSSEMSGIEVSVEEIPVLGEEALFYTVEDTTQQLWLLQDYAVFSLSLTLPAADEGQEQERLRSVGEMIVASMP